MIDLTNIGANQQAPTPQVRSINPVDSHVEDPIDSIPADLSNAEKIDDDTVVINGRQVKKRSNFTKQDLNKGAWTPDKFVEDGQIFAGEEDEAHKKFLQETTWVK